MKNRKLENLENLRKLRNVIPHFLISKFSILHYMKNQKLGSKKLGKNFPIFLRFPNFRVFDLARNYSNIAVQSRYIRIQTKNFK